MKAVVCQQFGSIADLVLEEVAEPEPGRGEVGIAVHAAGINFPDILTVEGKYQFKPDLPFVPGVEVAGEVTSVGEGVATVAPGDRVIASLPVGAFAEQCVTAERMVMPMGRSMQFEQAAAFAVTYGTAYYALKQRAGLRQGESVLVLGAAGGVGIATIQLAKAMGARVIAAASTEAKLDFACDAGADLRINYSEEDLKDTVKQLTDGKGADVVFDPVGGDYSEQAFRAIAWDGRFLVIGFASGPIPKMPLNLALLKGASLVGVFWGAWAARDPAASQQNFKELLGMIDDGQFVPQVTEVYPLDRFQDAFRCIAERRARGKVVLKMR